MRLLLLFALIVGSGSNAWADTKTYQHIFASGQSVSAGDKTFSTITWTVAGTNLNGWQDSYKGIQFGSSSKNGSISLTSKYNWGEQSNTTYLEYTQIKEIRIWFNLGGTSVTPSVTIGGKAATSDGTTIVKKSSPSDYTKTSKVTFTPASDGKTGAVVISATSVKAGYICAIEIDCEKVSKVDPDATFDNGNMNVGQHKNLNDLWSSNSSGAVTYSIEEGESYATLSGSTLTATAPGKVTIQATQAATAIYNSITKSAEITVGAAKTLNSIEITTAPTKTTYTEFEKFDPAGMIVTATYSDATTLNVAEFCTITPSGSLGVSDTEIEISYTENATTKNDYQAITVTAATGCATLPFDYDGNGTGTLPAGLTPSGLGTYENSPKMKFDDTGDFLILKIKHIPNTLKYDIKGNSFSGGTFTLQVSDDGETYTPHAIYTELGATQTVSINNLPASTHFIKWIYTEKKSGNVALGNIQLSGFSKNVSVSSTANYATFSDDVARDFSGSDITVYTAKANASSVSFTEVKDGIVPANVGVVLYKEGGITDAPIYKISTNKTTLANNEMVANVERTKVSATGEDGKTNYILSNETAGVGFYKAATGDGAYLAAHRAYLSTGAAASRSFLGFDDETTGIESIDVSTENTNVAREYYNLNGQRVTTPTKGLYIVNGKKVIINK